MRARTSRLLQDINDEPRISEVLITMPIDTELQGLKLKHSTSGPNSNLHNCGIATRDDSSILCKEPSLTEAPQAIPKIEPTICDGRDNQRSD